MWICRTSPSCTPQFIVGRGGSEQIQSTESGPEKYLKWQSTMFSALMPLESSHQHLLLGKPALTCCSGVIQKVLSHVLQLVRGMATFPTLIIPEPALLPAIGTKGQERVEGGLSLVSTTSQQIKGRRGSPTLMPWFCLTCNPVTQCQLYYADQARFRTCSQECYSRYWVWTALLLR